MTLEQIRNRARLHPSDAEALAHDWQLPLGVVLGVIPAEGYRPRKRRAPPPASPFAGLLPAPRPLRRPDGYGEQVARGVHLARAAIARGVPRDDAIREYGVPVRLWSRLEK